MTNPIKQHGAFSWNELMTTDVGAAKTFYGGLFGWALKDIQAGDMTYTMAKAGDKEVAGIMMMPPEAGLTGCSRSLSSSSMVNDHTMDCFCHVAIDKNI